MPTYFIEHADNRFCRIKLQQVYVRVRYMLRLPSWSLRILRLVGLLCQFLAQRDYVTFG